MTRRIVLREYEEYYLPRGTFDMRTGEDMWKKYQGYIDVQFPSPRTSDLWLLKPGGWVGCIPLTDEILLEIRSKVSIRKLFELLDLAYDLTDARFRIFDSMVEMDRMDDFFDRLARILADQILLRSKRGFHRSYIRRDDPLQFIKGRMNIREHMRRHWAPEIVCTYEEHTSDIEDNQIIAWTLYKVLRSGFCSPQNLPVVRRAYRTVLAASSLKEFSGNDCMGRVYSRLNDDYQFHHSLCRFFLDSIGPSLGEGSGSMMPFLIEMPYLFEMCVANWMDAHISQSGCLSELDVIKHYTDTKRGTIGSFKYDIDVLLRFGGEAFMVIDTKYKVPDSPDSGDVQQVVAYADVLGATEAVLVYPADLKYPIDIIIGNIHVRSLSFDLSQDLISAGDVLMKELLECIPVSEAV